MLTKKPNKIVSIIALLIILLLLIIKVFGIFKIFNVSENSMNPSLEIGTNLLTTNIINVNLNDVIVFNHNDSLLGLENEVYAFRIIGKSNDTIQLKKGIVYRNGRELTNIETAHDYKVNRSEYSLLKNKGRIISDYDMKKMIGDSLFVSLSDKVAKDNNLTSRRFTIPKTGTDNYIKQVYGQNWNKDFFGPLVISEGKYFVMGDNRDNANDSRFIGLIDKKQIIGTVITKW